MSTNYTNQAIPNPRNVVQIDRPIEEVKRAISHLPLFTKRYSLLKAQPELNQFRFEAANVLHSLYVDLNCYTVSGTITEVAMEAVSPYGAFNANDLFVASQHVDSVAEALSESLRIPVEERLKMLAKIELEQQQEHEKKQLEAAEEKRKDDEFKLKHPTVHRIRTIAASLLGLAVFAGIAWLLYKLIVVIFLYFAG